MDITKQIEKLLKDYAVELGTELELEDFQNYAADRMKHLFSIRGEVGYSWAVEQEALNVLVYSSMGVVDAADITDAKLLAFLRGALAIGVEALKAV